MKIKKLLILILSIITIIMCACFCGCTDEQIIDNAFGGRFGVVEVLNDKTKIIYDKETKVEYLYYSYNHQMGITVLVDENGEPLLYNGD